jgi:hypothetical protein
LLAWLNEEITIFITYHLLRFSCCFITRMAFSHYFHWSNLIRTNFTWHISLKCCCLWFQYMWWSTEITSKAWIHGTVVDILLKHGYMELSIIHVMEHEDTSIHVMFRWKSWVEELIHKQLLQFSSKFPKAQYLQQIFKYWMVVSDLPSF